MNNKLNWNIYTSKDRIYAIDVIKKNISSSDGYIISSNFFSDIALSLTLEIEERNIEKLHNAISSEMNISELEENKFDHDSEKEWWVFVNITFSKGTGDLEISIPEVPG